MKGFRWIKTGREVFGLEDDPRHFRGFVQKNAGNEWSWWITGGHSFGVVYSDERESVNYLCGESETKEAAQREVEAVVFSIHRYCQKTSFGKHDCATFEIENGEPVVRAVGTSRHCERRLAPCRLIVDVACYRKRKRVPQYTKRS